MLANVFYVGMFVDLNGLRRDPTNLLSMGAYLQSILMFWLVALLLSVFVLLLLLSLSLWLSLWLLLLLLLLLLAAAVAATTTTAATTAATTTTTTICPFASRLSVGVVLSAVMFGHFYIMSLGWTLFRWGGWSGACNHPTGTRTGLLRWVPLLLHASLMIPRSEREWLYTRIGMLQNYQASRILVKLVVSLARWYILRWGIDWISFAANHMEVSATCLHRKCCIFWLNMGHGNGHTRYDLKEYSEGSPVGNLVEDDPKVMWQLDYQHQRFNLSWMFVFLIIDTGSWITTKCSELRFTCCCTHLL